MRVLLSFEEEYRVYGQAIASAIGAFRQNVEVAVVDGEELEAEAERFDPHLVITSPPVPENPVDESPARIELSPDPDKPSRFRVGERRWESTNPTLAEILPVIEETERLLRRATHEQGEEEPTGTREGEG